MKLVLTEYNGEQYPEMEVDTIYLRYSTVYDISVTTDILVPVPMFTKQEETWEFLHNMYELTNFEQVTGIDPRRLIMKNRKMIGNLNVVILTGDNCTILPKPNL